MITLPILKIGGSFMMEELIIIMFRILLGICTCVGFFMIYRGWKKNGCGACVNWNASGIGRYFPKELRMRARRNIMRSSWSFFFLLRSLREIMALHLEPP